VIEQINKYVIKVIIKKSISFLKCPLYVEIIVKSIAKKFIK